MALKDIPFEETRVSEPDPPSLEALRAGGQARARWIAYWIEHPLRGALGNLSHYAFRILPSRAASAIGGRLALHARRFYRGRPFANRLEDNLMRLRPDLAANPERYEVAISGWWRNAGKVFSEYSVVDRLWREGRVSVSGQEILDRAQASGRPIVFVAVHLGTWELAFVVLPILLEKPCCSVFQPQENRFTNRIIHRLRRGYGPYIFPPSLKTAARLRSLAVGGEAHLVIFIDEVRHFQTHFPLFGRRPAKRGNAVVAVRIARAAGAIVVPVFLLRQPDGDSRLHVLDPVEPEATPGETVPDAIERLNTVLEPAVLANAEQWHMLAYLRLPPRV